MGNFADDKDWTKGANVTMPSWTEIPEDIWRAAEQAINAASDEAHENVAYLFVEYAARAILAERERCAKIADDHAREAWGHSAEISAAETIATAIRAMRARSSTGEKQSGGGTGPY